MKDCKDCACAEKRTDEKFVCLFLERVVEGDWGCKSWADPKELIEESEEEDK